MVASVSSNFIINRSTPCVNAEDKLFTSHQLLVTSYKSLVTSYKSLVTSYQSLVTSHQLIVTSHQLQVTSYAMTQNEGQTFRKHSIFTICKVSQLTFTSSISTVQMLENNVTGHQALFPPKFEIFLIFPNFLRS